MRVAVTGTPGTGKTTAVERLAVNGRVEVARDGVDIALPVVHLNDLIREAGLHTGTDPERGSLTADLDAVRDRLAGRSPLLVESHLAHHLEALDLVVVLRCHPDELARRLRERTGTGAGAADATAVARKANENAEAEALDVVLAAAVDRHGRDRVYEVETTDRDPDDVAREPSAGEVDYTDYLTRP